MKKTNNISKNHNYHPPGFLGKYRIGEDGVEYKYIPLSIGYLRLEYYTDMDISLLYCTSFVELPSESSTPIGNMLKFNLCPNGYYDVVTYISEMGVSGKQWSGGQVIWGHTYDDNENNSSSKAIEVIDLSLWIDNCIGLMINPPADVLNKIKKAN